MSLPRLGFGRLAAATRGVGFVRFRDGPVAVGHALVVRASSHEMNGECGAATRRALECEVEIQRLADRLCDRETQSGAAVLPMRLLGCLLERVEDRLLALRIDTDARIPDADSHWPTAGLVLHRDHHAAGVREPQRIAHEV